MEIKMPTPEEMKDERYFQIRDVDKRGCGSFTSFCVQPDASEQEIGDLASEIWTENRKHHEEMNNFRSGIFWQPFKWRQTVGVVEMKREIKKLDKVNERTGRDYQNVWTTKRGGMKLKIHNSYIKMVMTNGNVYEGNGYKY